MKSGIVILSELRGPASERIHEIQRRFDPKMAKAVVPHLTLTGSSGMGPIATRTSVEKLRESLEPIARDTAPLSLPFLAPMKFMQKQIVVLPLNPNGPLRALHERIKLSGLTFEPERFTFTPHVTLNFFRELPARELADLLSIRVDEPCVIDHIAAYRTVTLTDTKELLRLPLRGSR